MEIPIRVKDTKLKNIDEFADFQGKLKTIKKKDLDKLKSNILREGFIAPIFVWKNKTIDGTHRLKAIKELLNEGNTLKDNSLPYIEIEASNKKKAAKYILAYNSQYANITHDGLKGFVKEFDLDIDELKMDLNLNMNLGSLTSSSDNDANDVDKIGSLTITCPNCAYKFKKGSKKT